MMLLHLVPQIINRYSNVKVELIDVQLPELNVVLMGGKELVVRQPFPNKTYYVACRKAGRKAIQGVYLEVDKPLTNFSVLTRWKAQSVWFEKVLTHRVNYMITDTDFNVVSDDHTLQPIHFSSSPPVYTQPRMDVLIDEHHKRGELSSLKDEDEEGVMVNRVEDITLSTFEKEKLLKASQHNNRLPTFEQRFIVQGL
ncbi:DUF6012 family protein [Vibrio sp. TBV020]|uniref:DUF6012 family protein n=1 Tax=Vibrio sp. TBV020 TaxID=3137398 RepID=UPI0038CDA1FE